MRISIVCNKNLEVNEYNLILAFSEYKVIWKKYNNLLDGNDNLNIIFKSQPRRVSTYVHELLELRIFTT